MLKGYAPIPKTVWIVLLLVLALHVVGFAVNWWTELAWFDDLMHLLTPFAVTLLLAFYLYGRDIIGGEHRTLPLILVLTAVGLALGFLWEALEWSVRPLLGLPQEPPLDMTVDLVLESVGIVAAALLATEVTRD